MNTSRFRVPPSINQPLLSLPFLFRALAEASFTKYRGHERNSRIFSEGHPCFLHLPDALETKRTTERDGGRGREGRKKSPKEVRAKMTAYPRRRAQWILRIRRTSFILALLDVHISRSRSRRIDPSTPCRLCPLRNPTRSTGEPSDRRATPGDPRGSNKGSHPGERARPRYILAILRTRRQPAIRRRRRRNRRSAAISASSLALSLTPRLSFPLSFPLALSLSLPFLFSPSPPRGRPFSRSRLFALRRFRKPHQPQSARNARDSATPIILHRSEAHSHQDNARTVNRARKRDACTPTTTRALAPHRVCAHSELCSRTHAYERTNERARARAHTRSLLRSSPRLVHRCRSLVSGAPGSRERSG